MKKILNKDAQSVYDYLIKKIDKLGEKWNQLYHQVNCNSEEIGDSEGDVGLKFNELVRRIKKLETDMWDIKLREKKEKIINKLRRK